MEDQTFHPARSLNYNSALKLLGLSTTSESDDSSRRYYTYVYSYGNKPKRKPKHVKSAEIQQAYRRLARVHHPDRGGDAQSFLRLTAAKDFLLQNIHRSRTGFEGEDWGTSVDADTGLNAGGWSDEGSLNISSQVLMNKVTASYIRHLVAGHNIFTGGNIILVAMDNGLKIANADGGHGREGSYKLPQNGRKVGSNDNQEQSKESEPGSESVLCCALSSDGRFAFAGNSTGRILRFDLLAESPPSSSSEAGGINIDPLFENKENDTPPSPLVAPSPLDPSLNSSRSGYEYDYMAGVAAATSCRVVSLDIETSFDHTSVGRDRHHYQHTVTAAYQIEGCRSTSAAVVMLRFRHDFIETLWKVFTNVSPDVTRSASGPLHDLHTIETLMLHPLSHCYSTTCGSFSEGGESNETLDAWNVWMGGSNHSNEAILVNWSIHLPDSESPLQTSSCTSKSGEELSFSSKDDEVSGEEFWWSDSSDSDDDEQSSDDIGIYNVVPNSLSTSSIILGSGSIYSIDNCPELDLLAATVGSEVVLLKTYYDRDGTCSGEENNSSPQVKHRLKTNNTLYCVKIVPPSRQIIACGAEYSILIWSYFSSSSPSSSVPASLSTSFPISVTMQHRIQLNSYRQCNLCTNCIMALDWIAEEDEEGRSVVYIVSGGYDGAVTRWWWCYNDALSYDELQCEKLVERSNN